MLESPFLGQVVEIDSVDPRYVAILGFHKYVRVRQDQLGGRKGVGGNPGADQGTVAFA